LLTWGRYFDALQPLAREGLLEFPVVPPDCTHNGHMFYLKLRGLEERGELISHLAAADVQAVFHYIPLHSSKAGQKFGHFHGEDRYTTSESERLLRLPLWYGMNQDDAERVIAAVKAFF
jgi:dTDP-4-amino-4,6-dideoxygalactose transaminase